MTTEEIFDEMISDVFRRCTTCFKYIKKEDKHIVAYKNGIPAYFCREHIYDAEKYLDQYQEIVELKKKQ